MKLVERMGGPMDTMKLVMSFPMIKMWRNLQCK